MGRCERRRGRERGYVTAETAIVAPALVALLAMLLWALGAVATQLRCGDAARAAARAAARGEPASVVLAVARAAAPQGADVRLHTEDQLQRVEVRARTPGPAALELDVSAAATAHAEPRESPVPAIAQADAREEPALAAAHAEAREGPVPVDAHGGVREEPGHFTGPSRAPKGRAPVTGGSAARVARGRRGRRAGDRPSSRSDSGPCTGHGRAATPLGRDDRGIASVWGAAVGALLCGAFGAVLVLGQVVEVRQRVATGADLAALAAADHALGGSRTACAAAERVALAHRVRLARCDMAGEISDLSVEGGVGPYTVTARARAGPHDAAVP
ncbi:Rv3654c family TadE-like protein [Streptomyces sp. NRRL F-2890]|uniref:Rv3654c family TadE-like protein n=1 Tax=Streptomyces sp. NRRL F-2890 TaxID=1463845 RepID=UPI000B195086|nr:Rv3654c family TadE-like protein [Streptomyces sp. NRRL F-2890]